ncbi:hypothetical protein NDU88_004099 [Pleurodeles waltl]|uniref:Uncharacterized protein n=1 Tax=Pleurodeles waltl TaxID=8319 RepID=A0AAV7TQC3_PLEWA|nr:hypothetical protein NDU88_004099 [Pleurodeles waltl]
MLSLCASEGKASVSGESGVRLLQVRNTHSRLECSRQCKEALVQDGVSCNWSTVYQKRCLLMHCHSLLLCLRLKGGDIAVLLTGFKDFTKRKKRDVQTTLYVKRSDENVSNTTSAAVQVLLFWFLFFQGSREAHVRKHKIKHRFRDSVWSLTGYCIFSGTHGVLNQRSSARCFGKHIETRDD